MGHHLQEKSNAVYVPVIGDISQKPEIKNLHLHRIPNMIIDMTLTRREEEVHGDFLHSFSQSFETLIFLIGSPL